MSGSFGESTGTGDRIKNDTGVADLKKRGLRLLQFMIPLYTEGVSDKDRADDITGHNRRR